MEILKYFLITLIFCCFACQATVEDRCTPTLSVPDDIKASAKYTRDYFKAKWILYKMNIILGSGVEAGMPGSDSFAKTTKSLATLDLLYIYWVKHDEKSIYVFEFEGGLYPSEHPYYNTIAFFEHSDSVEISESERYSWQIDQSIYEDEFNYFLDTTRIKVNDFLKCYTPPND